eukprot:ANDGO_06350.mRNA.1 Deoxyribodipyrimidine photo-lyase
MEESHAPPAKRAKLELVDQHAGPTLLWFRTDLRVCDNRALHHAVQYAGSHGLLALFVISEEDFVLHDEAPVKIDFWLRNLKVLKNSLQKLHIPLVVQRFESRAGIPDAVLRLCMQHGIKHVCLNIEYEVDELRRDEELARLCNGKGIAIHQYHDQCIVPPTSLFTKEGKTYTMFSPFRKSWYRHLSENPELTTVNPVPHPLVGNPFRASVQSSDIPSDLGSHTESVSASIRQLWEAGEDHAQQLLDQFAKHRLTAYDEKRNFPSVNGTSSLSPYLASGVISARQCLAQALSLNKNRWEFGNGGCVTWISELCWRDFYRNILVAFPRTCMNQAFRVDMDKVQWRYDKNDFKAWCDGRTGYPIVDAAMRQLKQTGWMHNRLRMVVAMFLTKHLLIDWRWGERFFKKHLIDGDQASNSGGWQWSSSTGTDSQPYFRIFNPVTQSEKFDADGVFIKKYVPELQSVPPKELHEPWKHRSAPQLEALGYLGKPMVDHVFARDRCLTAFKSLKSKVA